MTGVTITTPTHQLRSYLARPAGEGPWPGVIVLHDAAGQGKSDLDGIGQTHPCSPGWAWQARGCDRSYRTDKRESEERGN